MTNQELTVKYRPIIEATGIFKMRDVMDINHKPHPYMIGSRHVAHAADHCGGMLGETTLKAIPCAHPGCHLSYKDHTSNKVIPLELVRNATNAEVKAALQLAVDAGMEADGVEGFIFIKTDFDFIKE